MKYSYRLYIAVCIVIINPVPFTFNENKYFWRWLHPNPSIGHLTNSRPDRSPFAVGTCPSLIDMMMMPTNWCSLRRANGDMMRLRMNLMKQRNLAKCISPDRGIHNFAMDCSSSKDPTYSSKNLGQHRIPLARPIQMIPALNLSVDNMAIRSTWHLLLWILCTPWMRIAMVQFSLLMAWTVREL